MVKLICNAILVGLCAGTMSMAACSAETPRESGPGPEPAASSPGVSSSKTGTVGVNLQLGGGVTLSTVNYTITNPTIAGFTAITGSIDVSGTQTVSLSITLPVGTGYTISLSGIDSNGDGCTAGPATFDVVAGQASSVGLTLVCTQTIDGGLVEPDVSVGQVLVTADASLVIVTTSTACAAVNSLVAMPTQTAVGNSISLTASGIDPNNQSSDVTLTWSATGGAGTLTVTSSTGTSSTFMCSSNGTEMVTVTASISDGGLSCPMTGSQTVSLTCGTVSDAGAADTGADSAPADAGASDTGADADAGADTGTPDVSAEAGTDASTESGVDAGPLVPCTTAGQANCVQCQGNDKAPKADKTCTPTEAAIVQHDIDKGIATVAGPDPSNGCYTCLYNGSCIDDTHFGDSNHECEDTLSGGTAAECETTLSCVFSSKCAATAVSTCYCGTAGALTTCQGNPASGPINGACASQIAAGNGFAVSDGTDNTAHLTDTTLASGKADQIFQCALTNSCTTCQN